MPELISKVLGGMVLGFVLSEGVRAWRERPRSAPEGDPRRITNPGLLMAAKGVRRIT
jgi:hypothetical protein